MPPPASSSKSKSSSGSSSRKPPATGSATDKKSSKSSSSKHDKPPSSTLRPTSDTPSASNGSAKKKNQTWTENELLEKLSSGKENRSSERSSKNRDSSAKQRDSSVNESGDQIIKVPKKRHDETPEERAIRKKLEKEALELAKRQQQNEADSHENKRERSRRDETEEQRAERKRREKEADESGNRHHRHEETPEERHERKRRERAAREAAEQLPVDDRSERRKHETPEERAERKRREKHETPEERAERKQREREASERKSRRENETPEERHERHKRERAAREAAESGNHISSETNNRRHETAEERAERKRAQFANSSEPQINSESQVFQPETKSHRRKDETREERSERKRREKENADGVRSNGHSKPAAEEKEEEEEEEVDYDNYEEDFEEYNYDEDFDEEEDEDEGSEPNDEEEDQPEVPIFQRTRFQQKPAPSVEPPGKTEPVKKSEPAYFSQMSAVKSFNFGGAKKSIYNDKLQKRSFALLNRIELDHFSADLFELAPLTEYDMYMRKFGDRDTSQIACQTRDDDCDFSLQTEELDWADCWTQQPPTNVQKPCERINQSEDQTTYANSDAQLVFASVDDSRKLNNFVVKAGQVMCTILGSSKTVGRPGRVKSYLDIADTFRSVDLTQNASDGSAAFLAGRSIVCVCVNSNHLLVVLRSDKEINKDKGLICVYNINSVSASPPMKYLVCSSELTTCCFSPSVSGSVVIAGSNEGVVYMWDLAYGEPVTTMFQYAGASYRLIYESYSTALFMRLHSYANCHKSPIVSLQTLAGSTSGNSGGSFQIVSLDYEGLLIFWTYHTTEDEDLTLLPGSLSKFSQSFSCNILSNIPAVIGTSSTEMVSAAKSLAACFVPGDTSVCFIATDDGSVFRVDCFSGVKNRAPHVLYKSGLSGVHCLVSCPYGDVNLLVVADSDGVLALLHAYSQDVVVLHSLYAVDCSYVKIVWPKERPTFVYALTTTALHVIDVHKFNRGPTRVCSMPPPEAKGVPVDMDLTFNPTIGRNIVVISFSTGQVELHDLFEEFSTSRSITDKQNELLQLKSLINRELLPTFT